MCRHPQLGESCLHASCKYGHSTVVEYLVSIHTNIDLLDTVSFHFYFHLKKILFEMY